MQFIFVNENVENWVSRFRNFEDETEISDNISHDIFA